MKISSITIKLAKLCLVYCFFFSPSVSKAQPYTLFSRSYGEVVWQFFDCIATTSDGGMIAVGSADRLFGISNYDIWVVRTDAWGDTLWTKFYGSPWEIGWDRGKAVREIEDGGFIILGRIFIPWDDVHANVWLIKTDSIGNVQGEKFYGGDYTQNPKALDITPDGGYIFSAFSVDSTGDIGAWVVRTDSEGDTLWTRLFNGAERDYLESVKSVSDGGYILAGHSNSFHSDSSDTSLRRDAWVVKLDSSGNTEWSKSYGSKIDDSFLSVLQTDDGGFVFGGRTNWFSGDTTFEAWLVKTDSAGNKLWENTYVDGGSTRLSTVINSHNGGYIFTGWSSLSPFDPREVYVVEVDVDGSLLWSRTYSNGIEDRGNNITAYENGYAIAGNTYEKLIPGPGDHSKGLIIRLGDPLSRLVIGTTEGRADELLSLPVRVTFPHELSFNFVHIELSGYQDKLTFFGLDTIGAVIGPAGWEYSVEESGSSLLIDLFGEESITADDTLFNLVFTAEEYLEEFIRVSIDSAIIDAGVVPVEFKNGGVQLLPVIKVDNDEASLPKRYSLNQNYPNPFNPVTTIGFDIPKAGHTTLIIYNMLGRVVKRLVDGRLESGSYSFDWDATGIPSGMYIYRLNSGDFVRSRKMVLLK